MPAHKHAAFIKAWADGAEIEVRHPGSQWMRAINPNWWLDCEYRIKPEPHKWQKEIDAYNSGKKVLYRALNGGCPENWTVLPTSSRYGVGWHQDGTYEYRIAPEPVVIGLFVQPHPHQLARVDVMYNNHNLKLTFEEGKLTKAEVL